MDAKIKSILFFSLTFILGFVVLYGDFEPLFVRRTPAAIDRKVFQIKNTDPLVFKQELKNAMAIKTITATEKYIEFRGFSSVICKQYSTIEVSFVADGVSVNGQAPEMKITAPCRAGQDPVDLASIYIPVDLITKQKPKNASFKFKDISSEFLFTNSSDSWPIIWVLKSVSFADPKTLLKKSAQFELSAKANPLVLEF